VILLSIMTINGLIIIISNRRVVFTLIDGELIVNSDYKWLNFYYYYVFICNTLK
jgi:hypothetical protein